MHEKNKYPGIFSDAKYGKKAIEQRAFTIFGGQYNNASEEIITIMMLSKPRVQFSARGLRLIPGIKRRK